MTRLDWTASGSHLYSGGVDRGVIYPSVGPGVAWNGLRSVSENPTGTILDTRYVDGLKYQTQSFGDSFGATIEAFTYPEELDRDLPFGLSYRTLIGNDVSGLEHGYLLHLVYNATAEPTSIAYSSLANSLEAENLSWKLSTRPVAIPGYKASSHLVIDSRVAYSWAIAELESILYGTEETSAVIPPIADVIDLFERNSVLRITDHGDGTWSAEGPDSVLKMLNSTTFQIDWPSAVYLDNNTYTVRSL